MRKRTGFSACALAVIAAMAASLSAQATAPPEAKTAQSLTVDEIVAKHLPRAARRNGKPSRPRR